MSNKSNRKFSKFFIYVSGVIGLSILGTHIYNKKIKPKKNLSPEEKYAIKKELKTLLEAEYNFTKILLNEDIEFLKEKSIDSVFDLNSIKFALEIYYDSINFETQEIKDLARVWFLNNVKILEGYMQKINEEEMYNSIKKLEKVSKRLSKLIKYAGLYDSLAEDIEIQGYIIGTYTEINNAAKQNNPVARHIYNLTKQ